MNLKNEFELGNIYVSFIYRTISFYRKHLKIACKLYTPLRLEVRGLFPCTFLQLTLKKIAYIQILLISLTQLW